MEAGLEAEPTRNAAFRNVGRIASAIALAIAGGWATPSLAQLSSLCSDIDFKVAFAPGSDELTPVARAHIGEALKGLRGCRLRGVVIVSFGDGGSSDSESLVLGERRGQAVSGGLSTFGIPRPLILTRPGPFSRAAANPDLNGEAEVYVKLSNTLQ